MKYHLIFAFILAISGSAFAQNPLTATYTVPVMDPALVPFATYGISTDAQAGYIVNPNLVKFRLPLELVGTDTLFTLTRENGTATWSGSDVDGVCELQNTDMKCAIRFSSVRVDLGKVRSTLQSRGLTAEEINGRLAVSERFSQEPIGILSLQVPKTGK